MSSRRAPPGLVLHATFVVACSGEQLELPPLDYESMRARIGVDDFASMPICVDDLAHIDDRIAFVEQHADVDRRDPLEIYVRPVEEIPCRDGVISCYSRDTDQIFTIWASLDHEIVHAVTRRIGFPSLFWSEGAAEVLSGKATHKATQRLEPSLLDARELDNYLSAAHFSRFLVETEGWTKYARIIRGEAFESVYDRTAAEVAAAYEADAPYSYPAIDPCPFPELAQVDDATWQETVNIDCTAAGTLGGRAKPASDRHLKTGQ